MKVPSRVAFDPKSAHVNIGTDNDIDQKKLQASLVLNTLSSCADPYEGYSVIMSISSKT